MLRSEDPTREEKRSAAHEAASKTADGHPTVEPGVKRSSGGARTHGEGKAPRSLVPEGARKMANGPDSSSCSAWSCSARPELPHKASQLLGACGTAHAGVSGSALTRRSANSPRTSTSDGTRGLWHGLSPSLALLSPLPSRPATRGRLSALLRGVFFIHRSAPPTLHNLLRSFPKWA